MNLFPMNAALLIVSLEVVHLVTFQKDKTMEVRANFWLYLKWCSPGIVEFQNRVWKSGGGGGWRGLDHESQVKFPFIHESRYLLESFHESRD